jgi:hypothetical protein
LEFHGEDGISVGSVRVYAPYKDERFVDWSCRFVIAWPGYEDGSVVFGEDSWGALFSVFFAVSRKIAKTPDFIAGRLSMFGHRLTTVEQIEELLRVWKSNP